MEMVQDGQCGLCAHYGEDHDNTPQLVQIRTTKQAPVEYVDECGHPKVAPLQLKVTPLSGCAGFEPAKLN